MEFCKDKYGRFEIVNDGFVLGHVIIKSYNGRCDIGILSKTVKVLIVPNPVNEKKGNKPVRSFNVSQTYNSLVVECDGDIVCHIKLRETRLAIRTNIEYNVNVIIDNE